MNKCQFTPKDARCQRVAKKVHFKNIEPFCLSPLEARVAPFHGSTGLLASFIEIKWRWIIPNDWMPFVCREPARRVSKFLFS